MDEEKRRRQLEATGWKAGSAAEFLGLSEDETKAVDLRLAQAYRELKEGDPMVDNTQLNLVPNGYARLNVTFSGSNGDLPDPVLVDATDDQIRHQATEALIAGSIPGIPASPRADLSDFVVDRFNATPEIPFSRVFVRPKTPFGLT